MKRARSRTSVLLFVLGGIAALPLGAQTTTLTGSVRTTGGDPLAARISILRGAPAAGIETYDTAADGAFSIKTSAAGVQAVSASADGSASQEAYRSSGAPFPPLHFVLAESKTIQGHVQDRSGSAQSGVRVRVRYIDAPRRLHLDDSSEAATDASGAFTLTAAVRGGGRFVVDALPNDWVPASSSVLGTGAVGHTGADEDESYHNILVELESRGSHVVGQVVSASGRGLADILMQAVVRVQTPRVNEEAPSGGTVETPGGVERPFRNELRKYVKTNSAGQYEIAGLPAGTLAVVALRAGTRVPTQQFTSVEGGTFTANFVLPD